MNRNVPVLFTEALEKVRRWCALQERSHSEVREKIMKWEMKYADVQAIISILIEEGFLNEERFARAYSGGKFRMKQWGRNKIVYALKKKGVSERNIEIALQEINDEDYRTTMIKLIEKKKRSMKPENIFEFKGRMAQYLIQKGFETEQVWNLLNHKYSNDD